MVVMCLGSLLPARGIQTGERTEESGKNKISKDTLKETGPFKEETEEGFRNGVKQ